MSRITFHVVFRMNANQKLRSFKSRTGLWYVTKGGESDPAIREDGPTPVISVNNTKIGAILTARKHAKNLWKNQELSQVVIHGKDGKIQLEWTYGKDPEGSKG